MAKNSTPKPIPASTIAVMRAVSSPAGRWARMIGGPVLIAASIFSGGWSLAFIPLGVMMFVTGVMNLCPAGLFFRRSINSEKLLFSFDQVDSAKFGLK